MEEEHSLTASPGTQPIRDGEVKTLPPGNEAATGLAAAWMMTRFAGFRIVTLYVSGGPGHTVLERLGIREEARGSKVWLVVPNDQGVFHGATDRDGIRCVHPVQLYLDLFAHPERAREAAEQLRAEYLNWRTDG